MSELIEKIKDPGPNEIISISRQHIERPLGVHIITRGYGPSISTAYSKCWFPTRSLSLFGYDTYSTSPFNVDTI